ncbi:hypothetical protein [Candidatus Reidiella endopervernicosa]|uniref:Glycosyl transferase family 28 C-terminal domain-containing protein n=1 Tax=Candidatus Reidiella endopervernicosa TaxID=2738883 RepID=A0A6N0HUY2_9GAMM|nr:hypothetical protein [Candidatus Reidiella endopervernicosa]QKQ26057.1 hypothetical protein HUE57_07000 [Candidatus Reidiella endopervernicosa]
MSVVLFTWELGAGMGHVMPYINAAKRLVDNGHDVVFAMRELSRAERLFEGTGIRYIQAPSQVKKIEAPIRPTNSYAQIIHNTGFSDVYRLTALVRAWQELYRMVKPDLVVLDHSPSALITSKGFELKRILIGSGFFIPPSDEQLPMLFTSPKTDDEKVRSDEQQVLDKILEVTKRLALPEINSWKSMFDVDRKLFRTFKELDHYGGRDDCEYLGIGPDKPGVEPGWPEGRGKRVFAYLKPFKTLPALLQMLNKFGNPTLIYGDGIKQETKDRFSSKTLKFVDQPLDMGLVGKSAQVAITNANHGTIASLLLAGLPQLLLPLQLEQMILASRVAALGVGLAAPKLRQGGMANKFKQLCEDERYQKAADEFVQRNINFDRETLTSRLVEVVQKLLKHGE